MRGLGWRRCASYSLVSNQWNVAIPEFAKHTAIPARRPTCPQALAIDARRHDALWCLGNAYTSQGFLSAEAASGAWLAPAFCLGGHAPSQVPVQLSNNRSQVVPPHPTLLRPCTRRCQGKLPPAPPLTLLPTFATLPAPLPAANEYFDKAGECFRKAVELEPGNDSYRRALEMSGKAPQLYQELQRQLQVRGCMGLCRGFLLPARM